MTKEQIIEIIERRQKQEDNICKLMEMLGDHEEQRARIHAWCELELLKQEIESIVEWR